MLEARSHDRTLGHQLRSAAQRHPDLTFLQFGAQARTYAEVNRTANQVANGLIALGVVKGAHIAIMAMNSAAFIDAWFGAAKAGAVYVPLNTDYKGEILRYQLAKADVSYIVIDSVFLDRLEMVIGDLPKLRRVILTSPMAGQPATIGKAIPVCTLADVLGTSAREPSVDIAATDPLAISFTSGTTGPSKGVLACHAHVLTFAQDWINAVDYRPRQAIYSCLPLFHAIAAWLGVVPALIAGGRIAIAQRFSASAFWDEVRAAKADVAHGIFSMVPILLKQPPRADDAEQPARVFYLGQQNDEFEKRFRCRIVEVYGATETGVVTVTPAGTPPRKGSCGKANLDTFDVMLANDRDEPVAAGEVGEILVRPRRPFVMLEGYYNMPEATLEAFQNLWFHTGDNARCDADGYYYFVDRKKDSIRRRGENISSYEVETVFNRHPAILECAAVAVPSELGEDEVKVVVVLRDDADVSASELWAFCEAQMPKFWIPRFLEFRTAMPKTPNQKIQKYLLRQGAEAGAVHDRQASPTGLSPR